MTDASWAEALQGEPERDPSAMELRDGSRVAVVGGGPAGSFFSYFLLEMAERAGLELAVDIYEPRDFSRPAPVGCNMCGGIISESLVQNLAADGINLPTTIVQRGIDSYLLHMDVGSVRIETPLHEKRIGAVYRGPGPRDVDLSKMKWGSFDGHLLNLAVEKGARVIHDRVAAVDWEQGRPRVSLRSEPPQAYDLLAGAVGVNSPALKLFQQMDKGYRAPVSTKTFIREYYLGEEEVGSVLGTSMHVFLLDIARLEFAAIVPKGDYVTVCLLGEAIDAELVQQFLDAPEVRSCFPEGWRQGRGSCQCGPRLSIKGAAQPFADRMVFIGDCGVTRLYKDGIGAAYRTAKAAATTAVFQGISKAAFRKHFWPACRAIETDNAIGRIVFLVTREIQRRRFARRAVLSMTTREQARAGGKRRMSHVLWDTFTGSAPYQEIFLRTLHPAFVGRLLLDLAVSLLGRGRASA